MAYASSSMTDHACMSCDAYVFSLSPCGHVFCAGCLVTWFSVAQEVNEDPYDERRQGLIRRKKMCPSCRAQINTPPVELWALKDVLAAIRNYKGVSTSTSSEIKQSLWDGLFNPTTFYHVIRDQDDGVLRCGMCSSEIFEGQCTGSDCGIIYENLSDEEQALHADNVHAESENESADEDEDAGSLNDFVVDDNDVEQEQESESASDDSSIVAVSPGRTMQDMSSSSEQEDDDAPPDPTYVRRKRLEALLMARARRRHPSRSASPPTDSESQDYTDEHDTDDHSGHMMYDEAEASSDVASV